jgi:hypothetical protein
MKNVATMALMLNLGVAGVYAQEKPVTMTYSGTEGTSAIDLQFPDTHTGDKHNSEFNFAGKGTLGSFTFRSVEADGDFPQQSSSCPANQVYFETIAGAGVFRFHDGSLLKVKLTEGFDCIDFVALEAHCTRIFQITGGTRRFKDASGMLTLTETTTPVAFASNDPTNPVFFVATGKFKGAVSGVGRDEEEQSEEQEERQ